MTLRIARAAHPMSSLLHSASRHLRACLAVVCSAGLTAALTACGGGGGGVSTAPDSLEKPAAWATPTAPVAARAAPAVPVLTVRAQGSRMAGVGPQMEVWVNGQRIGSVEVHATELADYSFNAPGLQAGSAVDVVFVNDAVSNGEDRNLFVAYVQADSVLLAASGPGVVYDVGIGAQAFDGIDTRPGDNAMYSNGALRFTWPTPPPAPAADTAQAARYDASRLLQQATFGPTPADITRVASLGPAAWLDQQMALPAQPDFVTYIQSKYAQGDAWRPGGAQFDYNWMGYRFWANVSAKSDPNNSNTTTADPLRKRVAFALHQVLVASLVDDNLAQHTRAYANYLDTLNQHAFGNYRTLLEEVALSPAMGIYLSHMRNRKEDPASGRLPDENFARELMQLFSIGLHELNADGSLRLDSKGLPIETYNNNDVMAMARVFTGWGWALPANMLDEGQFLWGGPEYSAAKDQRLDLQRMVAYPGQHSSAEKKLFTGKPQAVNIPAGSSAATSLKLALDGLFMHPNVAPFIGRQLIQRLVASNPSPAYVARISAVFNNNGRGVRGDLGAVVRAVLLDTEARTPLAAMKAAPSGKLREPVLRVAHWMRAFGATSKSGEYLMAYDLHAMTQAPLFPTSVFGYFRPGYVPPNTALSLTLFTAPEFQIVNESTTASWVNLAESMVGSGLGWAGGGFDVSAAYATEKAMLASGGVAPFIEHLNLLLFAGGMSPALKNDLLDAVTSIGGRTDTAVAQRVQVAIFLAMASPEYLVQR